MKVTTQERYEFNFPSGTLTLYDKADAEFLDALIRDAEKWRSIVSPLQQAKD